ncbi:MAG: hypothetical protein KDD66_01685 [Bdellovibrionales bacterium]|nr:hypothetical protein [Bdellovibrionales bacterium]
MFRQVHSRRKREKQVRQFDLHGEVQLGNRTRFSICGTDFDVDSNTFVIGDLELGKVASVHGVISPGSGCYATKIKISAA